ncbi:hypothetical protein EON65_51685 [archaeon]|nr:MAG: hypothetical protein EON65_51685 [archaeon]
MNEVSFAESIDRLKVIVTYEVSCFFYLTLLNNFISSFRSHSSGQQQKEETQKTASLSLR